MSRKAPGALALSALLTVLPALIAAQDVRGAGWSAAGGAVVNVNAEALAADTLTVVTFNMLHGFGSRTNDATAT